MKPDIATCVASLLKASASPSLPLSRLHVALVSEVGPSVGTYAQLRSELARRSDLFLILEPHDPLGEIRDWSGRIRDEYEAALLDAGGGPRVALAGVPPPPVPPIRPPRNERMIGASRAAERHGMLHQLDASLVQLWGASGGDPVLRADLAEAMAQTEEIRRLLTSEAPRRAGRSTSRLPGPRSPA